MINGTKVKVLKDSNFRSKDVGQVGTITGSKETTQGTMYKVSLDSGRVIWLLSNELSKV